MSSNKGELIEAIEAIDLDDRNEILDDLIALWERSVRASHTFLTERNIAEIKPQVAPAIVAISHFLMIREAGQIVAFMGVEEDSIEMLFIDPVAWKKGYGRALIQYAIDTLDAVYVDVNEDNHGARAFYEALGFAMFDYSETDGVGNPFPIMHLKYS
ncbi:MAG: GNAT family N-acetyltransferase [Xanthomonadaceae bacterium]|nr:GNAT family N-acetyltransferase [Xanthomonadaceae bacterium]